MPRPKRKIPIWPERALAVAREVGFGKVDGFPGDNQPFSITTFLVGQNVAPLAAGSDEHLLLETAASWNRQLKAADLAKLPRAGAELPIRDADDHNVMYGRKHGRAIWLTRAFDRNPDTPTLACYHRNVTQASLQTLSLGEFVSWTAAQHDAQPPVDPAVRERAKRAASLLQLFFDGKTASGKRSPIVRQALRIRSPAPHGVMRWPWSKLCPNSHEMRSRYRIPGRMPTQRCDLLLDPTPQLSRTGGLLQRPSALR